VTNGAGWKQRWAVVLLRGKNFLERAGYPLRFQMECKPSDAILSEIINFYWLMQITDFRKYDLNSIHTHVVQRASFSNMYFYKIIAITKLIS
jgi:hypothetical protein